MRLICDRVRTKTSMIQHTFKSAHLFTKPPKVNALFPTAPNIKNSPYQQNKISHRRISRKRSIIKRLSCVHFNFFRVRIKIAIYSFVRAKACESKVIQEFVVNLLETMPFSGRGRPNMEETGTTVTLMMAFHGNRSSHYYTCVCQQFYLGFIYYLHFPISVRYTQRNVGRSMRRFINNI